MRFGRKVKTAVGGTLRRVHSRRTANRPFWLPLELAQPDVRFSPVVSPQASPARSKRDEELMSTRESFDNSLEVAIEALEAEQEALSDQMFARQVEEFVCADDSYAVQVEEVVLCERAACEAHAVVVDGGDEDAKPKKTAEVAEVQDVAHSLLDVDYGAVASALFRSLRDSHTTGGLSAPLVVSATSGFVAYVFLCFLWYFRLLWLFIVVVGVYGKIR